MMSKKLTVVAGPANSGKTPIAQFIAKDTKAALVHRDQLRTLLNCHMDESTLTDVQADLCAVLLSHGISVVAVGQNMAASDRGCFESAARQETAHFQWIDSQNVPIPDPTDPSRTFTISDFEEITNQTALYPDKGRGTIIAITYCALGLGEAGEVQGKLKKVWREDKSIDEQREPLLDELGDTLWYVVRMAKELGSGLQDLMNRNGRKLLSRHLRGTLRGDGDNR